MKLSSNGTPAKGVAAVYMLLVNRHVEYGGRGFVANLNWREGYYREVLEFVAGRHIRG